MKAGVLLDSKRSSEYCWVVSTALLHVKAENWFEESPMIFSTLFHIRPANYECKLILPEVNSSAFHKGIGLCHPMMIFESQHHESHNHDFLRSPPTLHSNKPARNTTRSQREASCSSPDARTVLWPLTVVGYCIPFHDYTVGYRFLILATLQSSEPVQDGADGERDEIT